MHFRIKETSNRAKINLFLVAGERRSMGTACGLVSEVQLPSAEKVAGVRRASEQQTQRGGGNVGGVFGNLRQETGRVSRNGSAGQVRNEYQRTGRERQRLVHRLQDMLREGGGGGVSALWTRGGVRGLRPRIESVRDV